MKALTITTKMNLISMFNIILMVYWFAGHSGGMLFSIAVFLTLVTFNVMEDMITVAGKFLFPKSADPTKILLVCFFMAQTYLLFPFSWTVFFCYMASGVVLGAYMAKRMFG